MYLLPWSFIVNFHKTHFQNSMPQMDCETKLVRCFMNGNKHY